VKLTKYDKQDRQGKAAFNERSPHPTQRQGAQEDPKEKTVIYTLQMALTINVNYQKVVKIYINTSIRNRIIVIDTAKSVINRT
jgi:hypothetical protein